MIRLVCLLVAMIASAPAQQETLTTEFITLSFNASTPGYFYRNGNEISKLEVSRHGIGAPVLYRGPRVLSLYRSAADLSPPPDGKEAPKPDLQVRLPAGIDRVLLLFAFQKGADKKAKPKLQALPISAGKLKEGDYRIYNLSTQTVYAAMNEEKAAVPPNKPVDISSGAWRSNALDMSVQFGIRVDGKTRSVYSSVWGHRPVRRTFLFVFDRPDKYRPLDIRMFYDLPSIKAPREDSPSED